MTREELRHVLQQGEFRDNAYDLNGEGRSECYVLSESDGSWTVHYAERGLRTGEHSFDDEAAACDWLLKTIHADATTRR